MSHFHDRRERIAVILFLRACLTDHPQIAGSLLLERLLAGPKRCRHTRKLSRWNLIKQLKETSHESQ
jgi:hypothetical protein